MNKQLVKIFDTTLRDGEQTPGVTMTAKNKVILARQLEKLGVDIIEAGFPASSKEEMKAVSAVAKNVKQAVVCALARATALDIDMAWEGIKQAKNPRIHVFVSSSQIHLEQQLKKTPEEVLVMAEKAVKRAKGYTSDVEFSAMDATRTDPTFLYRLLETAIEAGATTLNIPDTVGYAMPEEFGHLIKNIYKNVSGINKAVVSVHCHNDLGLATANSLMAVGAGARQVECTINGIGERAGNAALEEVVMSIHTREDCFNLGTNINTSEIFKTSQMVKRISKIPVQPNKAIVGDNAFRHQSGIHQDGMVKNRQTYEIIRPESVGLQKGNLGLVLGKNSGRSGFKEILKSKGYSLKEEHLDEAFVQVKNAAGRGIVITDAYLSKALKNFD